MHQCKINALSLHHQCFTVNWYHPWGCAVLIILKRLDVRGTESLLLASDFLHLGSSMSSHSLSAARSVGCVTFGETGNCFASSGVVCHSHWMPVVRRHTPYSALQCLTVLQSQNCVFGFVLDQKMFSESTNITNNNQSISITSYSISDVLPFSRWQGGFGPRTAS